VLIPVRYMAEWLDEVDDVGAPVELDLANQRLHWRCGPYCARRLQRDDELPLMAIAESAASLPRVSAAAVNSVVPALMAGAHGRDDRVHINAEHTFVSLYTFGRDQAVLTPLPSDEHGVDGDWCSPRAPSPC
jgi:hypothetical protein